MAKPRTRRQGTRRPEQARRLDGARRDAALAQGGLLAWQIGRPAHFKNRKADAARKACRGANRKADR